MDPEKVDGRGRNLSPETRRRITQAGGAASMAALTPEERKRKSQDAVASRELKRAEARHFGDAVDKRSPEARRTTATAGGRARVAELTPEELKDWAAKGNEKAGAVLEVMRRAFGTIDRDKFITLPRSSPKSKFVKLIHEITDGPAAFGWKGIPLRPGGRVMQQQLRPDKTWPPAPLLLECAGACGRDEHVWVLWALRGGKWHELGRCGAQRSEWTEVLQPLAERVLSESALPKDVDGFLPKQFEWITTWLDKRFRQTPKRDRMTLLEWLYDWTAARAALEMPNTSDVIIELQ